MSLSKPVTPHITVGPSVGCNLSQESVLYSVSIPYTICKDWAEIAQGSEAKYQSLLEAELSGWKLGLDLNSLRVAQRLRRECPSISKKLKKAKGNSLYALQEKILRVNLKSSDLLSFSDLKSENVQLASDLSSAEETIKKQNEEILLLHQELFTFKQQCDTQQIEIGNQNAKIDNLMETNKDLHTYVEHVIGISVTSGPKAVFSGVCRQYQLKTLKQLKSRAECALWFVESFGLNVESIQMRDSDGIRHTMAYQNIDQISMNEKEILKKIFYLLDRFYISDAFYHEITAVCDGLPRSYLIKQLRSDMNMLCHIQRTPGAAEGAEVDVEQELKCAIHSIIAENPNAKHFSVKFCGDGTHVARSAGMCLMSFSVTSPGARMSKSACHHAVAVVKGQESYTLYNTSFRNIFNSINALAASKRLDINGEEMAIDVFLGGDYKFLLMVLGGSFSEILKISQIFGPTLTIYRYFIALIPFFAYLWYVLIQS